MSEVGETPPEVAAQQQAPPKKEPFVERVKRGFNRLLGKNTSSTPEVPTGLSGTRTAAQINEAEQQIPTTPEQPQETIPAPGEPGYEPLTKESPTPEWERQAQLRYAAEQTKLEQNEPETSAETTQPEQEDASKPVWLQKEEARLREGYAKEAISQVPQTPAVGVQAEQSQTTQESPTVEQPTAAPAEQVAVAPEIDKSFAQKVLDTPVKELEKELPEGAGEALEEAGQVVETEAVAPPPPVAPAPTELSPQTTPETAQPQAETAVPVEGAAPVGVSGGPREESR